ncbi:MAG: PHP domain-containing protein [Christensenellales bacterium]
MTDIVADYHTHTRYSHGKGTIEENVQAAIKKGLECIGITDHGLGHVAFGLRPWEIRRARDECVRIARKVASKIEVLFGVEANLISIDGDIDIIDQTRGMFDIVLLGFHSFAWISPGSLAHFYWRARRKGDRPSVLEAIKVTTDAYIKAIKKHKIDILTHLNDPIPVDVRRVARAAAEYGTAIEINNRHKSISREELIAAMEEGADFVVSSDAHKPEDIGRFEAALELIKECALPPGRIVNARGSGISLKSLRREAGE